MLIKYWYQWLGSGLGVCRFLASHPKSWKQEICQRRKVDAFRAKWRCVPKRDTPWRWGKGWRDSVYQRGTRPGDGQRATCVRVLTAPTVVLGFLWRGFKRWTSAMNQSSLGWSLFWLIDEIVLSLCLPHVSLSALGLILMKYKPNFTETRTGNRELFLKGYQRAEFCFTVCVPNNSSGQICLLTLYPQIHWDTGE